METVENQSYGNERLTVDGKQFKNCQFNGTRLAYAGTAIPTFENCTFKNVSLEFDDAASNTMKFLSGLYQGGMQRGIESIFETIRSNQPSS